MNKFNNLGIELINYKHEILRNYPDIVKKSLHLSVDQLLQNNMIDIDTHYALKDDGTGAESFKEYILTKPAYMKTVEELLVEYEALREKLNQKLADHEMIEKVHTQSYVDKEKITISKTFMLNEEYIMAFFGVPKEDLEKLMKRKGFVEKYAVLRLPKILGEYLKAIDYPPELFKCGASLVYYDVDNNGYSIDLLFEIPIEIVEDENNGEEIVLNIKDIIANAVDYYNTKTVI
jgi:hypothetical protein